MAEHGFDGITQAITILVNEAMKLERVEALGAGTYERTERRRGYANRYKPKTVRTRVGQITVDVPQARGVDFSFPGCPLRQACADVAPHAHHLGNLVSGYGTIKLD